MYDTSNIQTISTIASEVKTKIKSNNSLSARKCNINKQYYLKTKSKRDIEKIYSGIKIEKKSNN